MNTAGIMEFEEGDGRIKADRELRALEEFGKSLFRAGHLSKSGDGKGVIVAGDCFEAGARLILKTEGVESLEGSDADRGGADGSALEGGEWRLCLKFSKGEGAGLLLQVV